MVIVRPDLFEERESRRRDLLQQKLVGAVEIEEGRKLSAYLLADRIERPRIGHQPVDGEEQLVEETLVTAVFRDGGQDLRRERREFYGFNLIDEPPCQEAAQARILGRRQCVRQEPQDEARKSVTPFG